MVYYEILNFPFATGTNLYYSKSELSMCNVESSLQTLQARWPLMPGFQVIAQLTNASELQKLYVNQSMDPYTPVTVEVERDGLYQVTIFPMREGRGILDSRVECTEHVLVAPEETRVLTTENTPRTLLPQPGGTGPITLIITSRLKTSTIV